MHRHSRSRTDVGGLDQVEIVVIPHIHLADAPATLEGLGHGARAPHDTAPAMSLGSRTRLYAAAAKAKAHPTRIAAAELGPALSSHGLDPAERLLDALADALASTVAGVTRRAS